MPAKVRRIVTGHDENGKAIVLMDGDAPNVKVRAGAGIASTLLWVTDETPADLSKEGDAANREIGVPPPRNGSIFRIVEFPPEADQSGPVSNEDMLRQMGAQRGGEGPPRHPGMHRTASIDYAVVMDGEIDMLLDDTDLHLRAGDVVIQAATNHAWANRSGAPCRVAFILIGAVPPWE